MTVQDRYNAAENNLNNNLEMILKESRREIQERTQTILLGINSHAMEAKKEVRHHISQLVQVQSAMLDSNTHRNV